MRALFDVNVLIALLDASHAFHRTAMDWLEGTVQCGWASCPITQNGCIRIMSNPNYPDPLPAGWVAERLAEAAAGPEHSFWPDDISLLGTHVFECPSGCAHSESFLLLDHVAKRMGYM